jgi:magnesium chelatase family protein
MLVAAMNPCPCGYADDPKHACRCTQRQIAAYRAKISGPLLDRIDIQIALPPVPFRDIVDLPAGESSAAIRARVVAAREIQKRRFAGMPGGHCNCDIRSRYLPRFCRLDSRAQEEMRLMLAQLDLSARAYDRVLKVARTIADLAGSEKVESMHIAEAIGYRNLDRGDWAERGI